MAHHEFTTPVTEAQVRALKVDDTVTLHGTLYGIRDATQIAMFDRGRTTRFDLAGHAVIHTAPNVKKVPVSPAYPAGYAPAGDAAGFATAEDRVAAALDALDASGTLARACAAHIARYAEAHPNTHTGFLSLEALDYEWWEDFIARHTARMMQ